MSGRIGLLCAAMAWAAVSTASADPAPLPGGSELKPGLWMGPANSPPADGQVRYQRGPAVAGGLGARVQDEILFRYLLAWQDGYNGLGGESNILAARLDESGKPLDARPIAVCAAAGAQDSPAVAFADGVFLVAWSDFRNGTDYDVRAAIVDAGTGKAGPEFVIAAGKGGQVAPAVASDGKGTFLVVWQDHRSGQRFDVYGTRVSADGKVLDPEGLKLLEGGERPAVAFNGAGGFLVSVGDAGCLVGLDGKASPPITLWSKAKRSASASATAAWGKALSFYNVSAYPDPWGWGGNGTIIGASVTANGQSPENAAAAHDWYHAAANQADRVTKNAIDASRWRNHNGWPMGMPGGFKGSHDGAWISGPTAAAYNGRSVVVVYTVANFLDILRIANRDLYLKRVLDNWACIDEPRVKLAAGPTEESFPVLAAGPVGDCLLAYERQRPEGGVAVDYRLIREAADTQPPQVAYVQKMSDSQLILGFDEPLDPASVKADGFTLDGTAVKSAVYLAEGPSLHREVRIDTAGPLAVGKRYTLKITGLADLFGNAAKGQPFVYVARPGAAQRSDFVARWAVIGPFTADYEANFAGDPAKVRPAPGEKTTLVGGVERTWKAADCKGGCTLDLDALFGKPSNALAYAHTYFWSDGERDALVRIDSNDGHQAWLNGKRILDNPSAPKGVGRGFHDRTDEAAVRLAKGWNRLLVGCDNTKGYWLLAVQVTDPARQPIRDLTWQLERPAE